MRLGLSALALLAAACAQQTRETHPPLADALRLEMRLPGVTQRAETTFEVDFALRNVSGLPLAFCQAESGVSVGLARPRDPAPHPVLYHSLALNPRDGCHEAVVLAPGAAKEFRERVRIRADLAGPGLLLGQIRVHRQGLLRNDGDMPTIRSRGAWITVLR